MSGNRIERSVSEQFHVEELLDSLKRGRLLLSDGGLATELEAQGEDLTQGKLWSARLLLDKPEAIARVHHEYLMSGCDIITTSSYQATIDGFTETGLSATQSASLLRKSIDIARDARTAFIGSYHPCASITPVIAASIGCYGASLADGSEFRGDYKLNGDQLKDFHRKQLKVLSECNPDLIAFETVPCSIEAIAIAELLRDEFPHLKAWISFSCNQKGINNGDDFAHAVESLQGYEQIIAIGINCTSPEYVTDLLKSCHARIKPFIVYPNKGEKWNEGENRTDKASQRLCAVERKWEGNGRERQLCEYIEEWKCHGAQIFGGCCRTRPQDMSLMRKRLDQY
ncbi:homocysteine S-methyltransferase [Planoprotostelium fungivorum]|uniref:Homocysteine S-methyltransferase n=1 Tax=Planoprotostelium fungivorum TaxID=1890364 RepID=A0A2P6NYW5_9EUKA|nr:homocysteine S-methyltransferase [Planoprotostelium fungivorum]